MEDQQNKNLNNNLKIKNKNKSKRRNVIIIFLSFVLFLLLLIWHFYPIVFHKSDFDKYCKKESDEHYICSYQGILRDISLSESRRIVANIKRYCTSKGFEVDEYNSIQCYNFTDEGKECSDNNNCNSGVCIPFDIFCEENCKGQCWNGVNFGTIGGPECIDGNGAYILKDGKIKILPCWLSKLNHYKNKFAIRF